MNMIRLKKMVLFLLCMYLYYLFIQNFRNFLFALTILNLNVKLISISFQKQFFRSTLNTTTNENEWNNFCISTFFFKTNFNIMTAFIYDFCVLFMRAIILLNEILYGKIKIYLHAFTFEIRNIFCLLCLHHKMYVFQ